MTQFEIKPREVVVSLGILAIMLALGFAIHHSIAIGAQRRLEQYTTAVQIEDERQFRYGMDTNFGNALVYGTMSAIDPVTYPEVGDGFLYIQKTEEHYTRHTYTTTTTDANGNTHTTTHVYYSWDFAGREARTCTGVRFLSEEFPSDKFRYQLTPVYLNGERYLTDGSTRWYFDVVPASFAVTIHTDLRDGTIADDPEMFTDQTPQQVVSDKLRYQNLPMVVFWIFWGLLTASCIAGFVYTENNWLDD